MVKKIKLPLEMANGVTVRTIEELKENWDLEKIVFYYNNGRLLTWLNDRYYSEQAQQLKMLVTIADAHELQKQLCSIFDMPFVEEESVDVEAVAVKNEKLAKLRKLTSDDEILKNAEKAAFNQEELAELLDDDVPVIYLANNTFTIPVTVKNKKYVGVGAVTAVINSKKPIDFDALGIIFKNIKFDDNYNSLFSDNDLNSALPQQENDSISATEQTTHNLSSKQHEDETKTVSLKDADVREKYEIQGLLSIDEQGKIFKDKIIVISNNIECKGTLTFDNCEILYHDGESENDGQIKLIGEAKLVLKHCEFHCSEYNNDSSYKALISSNHSSSIDIVDCDFYGCSGLIDETSGNEFSRIIIKKSRFYNCINLIIGAKLEDELTITNDCYFEYTNKNLLNANLITVEEGAFYLEETVVTTKKGARKVVENLLIGNDCLHTFMDPNHQRHNYMFVGNGSFFINNCRFSYIRNCLYGASSVRHCKFESCIRVIKSDNATEGILYIEEKCEFINCIEAFEDGNESFNEKRIVHIKKCNFKGWNEKAPLMIFSNLCLLEGCEFEDITIHGNHGLIELSDLEGASDKRVTALNVKTCTFKNVCVDITNIADEGERNKHILDFGSINHEIIHDDYVVFSNCKFVNCKGILIDCDLTYKKPGILSGIFGNSTDSFNAISLEKCTGIDSEGRAIQ